MARNSFGSGIKWGVAVGVTQEGRSGVRGERVCGQGRKGVDRTSMVWIGQAGQGMGIVRVWKNR